MARLSLSSRWVLLAALLTVASSVDAFKNGEYGLDATIPSGFPECVARSGTGHIHGVGTVLIGRDCENRNRQPAFDIWADYNTADYPDALEVLRSEQCTGSRLRWTNDEWSRAIGGLRTAVCRFEGSGDSFELRLAAQAWRRPGETLSYINYTVHFIGMKSRADRDLQVLRGFVRTIRIVEPESLRGLKP
jgi:hypothetical protein